jgi:asparagine synthase (glutamine-hydrolysing)
MSYGCAIEGVRERLIDAVKLRLRADVPLAFCMSGGVDSNALISIAKNKFNYDVHGFTIVNTDSRYEEATIVERAVSSLGIKHTGVKLSSQGFLKDLRKLIKSHDAPISTISYYVHWQLMQYIHESGFKISISGTGADEIFSGYYDHYNAYLYEIRNLNLFDNEFKAWDKFVKPLIRNTKINEWNFYLKNPEYRGHLFQDWHEFGKYFKKDFNEKFKENNYSGDLLRNRMANELYEEVVPVILNEDDLNAMYFSIENRSPFLDSNLIEFCNTIPTKLLIKNGYNKSLLRDAMIDIAPDFILNNRNKIGFNAPISDLLGAVNEKDMQDILSDNPVFEMLDKQKIKDLLMKKNLSNSESKFIFNLLNIKYFYEEFL